VVSLLHCSCGFGADDAGSFADHLHLAFARDDDTGTDGRQHAETARDGTRLVCACGLTTSAAELDDHLLMAFITPDAVGTDGERHVPVDTTTPLRWYAREAGHE
jgi:hypothetical protein